MKVNNPKYKDQGIHAIAAIFTVQKGITKVLLVNRKNEPFKNMWALVGGAIYNDENLDDGMRREIYEKTGIKDLDIFQSGIFGKKDRSPVMRMVAISYIGVIDSERVEILKESTKTTDADWIPIDKVPDLAYDHNEILKAAIVSLQESIVNSNILKSLFPNGFTIPEIQKTYETILNKNFDRRNFRRKLLGTGLIVDTNSLEKFEGRKPAKFYLFKDKINTKNVF